LGEHGNTRMGRDRFIRNFLFLQSKNTSWLARKRREWPCWYCISYLCPRPQTYLEIKRKLRGPDPPKRVYGFLMWLGWEVMTTEMPLKLIDEKKCQCGNREEMQEQIKELQLRISHLEKMAGPK